MASREGTDTVVRDCHLAGRTRECRFGRPTNFVYTHISDSHIDSIENVRNQTAAQQATTKRVIDEDTRPEYAHGKNNPRIIDFVHIRARKQNQEKKRRDRKQTNTRNERCRGVKAGIDGVTEAGAGAAATSMAFRLASFV